MTNSNIISFIENRYDFDLKSITISGDERKKILTLLDYFSHVRMQFSLLSLYELTKIPDKEELEPVLERSVEIEQELRDILAPDLDDVDG